MSPNCSFVARSSRLPSCGFRNDAPAISRLPPCSHAFITTSREAEQARTEAERQQVARTRRFQKRATWALVAVALLVATGAISAALLARQTAEREARVLTGLAQEAIEGGYFDRAMRIAVHGLPPPGALPFVTYWSRELEAKLAGAALMSRQVAELRGHSGRVTSLAFDRKGTRVLRRAEDGSARIWDIAAGATIAVMRGEEPGATHAAILSPDGRLIATASGDTTVRLWDAATGRAVLTLRRSHAARLERCLLSGRQASGQRRRGRHRYARGTSRPDGRSRRYRAGPMPSGAWTSVRRHEAPHRIGDGRRLEPVGRPASSEPQRARRSSV